MAESEFNKIAEYAEEKKKSFYRNYKNKNSYLHVRDKKQILQSL